ncbi:MAG TPA: hypoxanthine phosphoribosyltransferase, partial [Ktedonobacterales bacterium]|nr:hypoxanthine phosphoribosyltransferase [Ktedonobacterales bacterium]
EETLISEQAIQARVAELGAAITRDYAGKDLVLLGILRGSLIFLADLARQVALPLEIDTIVAASYGDETHSSGVVKIVKDIEASIEGRHVVIVEDIIDTGLTLRNLLELLRTRSPASLRVCTLLVKDRVFPEQGERIEAAYVGFHVPDRFVVGYGLDYAQRYRNLPFIGVLKPEVYTTTGAAPTP